MSTKLSDFNRYFGVDFTEKEYAAVLSHISWDDWVQAEDWERDEFIYAAIEQILIERENDK